uniref:Uncharacterized protein LOC105632273 isoform X2 n=1 Tax=Rhizophora mucronata TaxID=61149 RepID=A0A2P2JCJ5_RHIMU
MSKTRRPCFSNHAKIISSCSEMVQQVILEPKDQAPLRALGNSSMSCSGMTSSSPPPPHCEAATATASIPAPAEPWRRKRAAGEEKKRFWMGEEEIWRWGILERRIWQRI